MSTSRYASGKTVSVLALLTLVCMIIPGATSHVAAQQAATEQTPVSYEGQRVMSVEVAGQPDLSRRAVVDLFSLP